jgi:NAD(P)-dependent dehydrogenase (short-subunit alcohol dehydrogenase family)
VIDIHGESAQATAEEIRKLSRKALPLTLDVTDISQIHPTVERVVQEFGAIHIWVNNAGVMQTKAMLKISEKDWDKILGVNAKGTFFCTQAAGRQMVKQRNGLIVNITSGQRARPMATHYAASKMGVDIITKSAALAFAPYNVRVNAIDPGLVDTPMFKEMDDDRVRLFGLQPGEATKRWVASIPLGRMTSVEEIGGLIAFLASADAVSITGQIISVTGGVDLPTLEKAVQVSKGA